MFILWKAEFLTEKRDILDCSKVARRGTYLGAYAYWEQREETLSRANGVRFSLVGNKCAYIAANVDIQDTHSFLS